MAGCDRETIGCAADRGRPVQRLQIARELRRTIDVATDDVKGRDAGHAQRLFGRAPRDFVEIGADNDQRVRAQVLSARRLTLHGIRCASSVPSPQPMSQMPRGCSASGRLKMSMTI